MSDSKLRELERRWRETGTVDDEAAYLRERVRVGDLTQERLELAAYCGHEGARRIVGETPLRDLRDWGEGLARWGKEVAARAAVAALAHVGGASHPAVLAVQDWLACPCPDHEARVREAADATWWEAQRLPRGREATVTSASGDCAEVVTCVTDTDAAHWSGNAAIDAAAALDGDEATMESQAQVLRAIGSVLVPWALRSSGTPP